MAYDYTNISNTAKNLIDKFGRSITLRSVTTSGTEWNPTITNSDSIIIGVFTKFDKSEIDGNLILSTDKKVLTYDEVTTDDKIVDSGITYEVKSVNPIQPANTKIIYKVQLRQ